MVQIPLEVKELIESQGIFVVGSIGGNKFVNISPRIFFEVREEVIYWLIFFNNFKSFFECRDFIGCFNEYLICHGNILEVESIDVLYDSQN